MNKTLLFPLEPNDFVSALTRFHHFLESSQRISFVCLKGNVSYIPILLLLLWCLNV